MRRMTCVGLVLCLMSISGAAFAQTAPPAAPSAWPTVPSTGQPTPPTWEQLTIDPLAPAPPTPSPPTVEAPTLEAPTLGPATIEPPTPAATPLPQPTARRDDEPSLPTAGAKRTTHEHWYGWETLLVDGVSILTCPIIVGCFGYVLGGPIA